MGNSETLFLSFDRAVWHVIKKSDFNFISRDFQNFIYLMSLMTFLNL